jgi:hypothetical protein
MTEKAQDGLYDAQTKALRGDQERAGRVSHQSSNAGLMHTDTLRSMRVLVGPLESLRLGAASAVQ